MVDMSCLADGLVVPANFEKTGRNLNEIIVGGTGSGKSFSNAYSRLLHTYNSSVMVTFTKKRIRDIFAKMFEDRGYEVINLNLINPEESDIGYDPFDHIHNERDVINFVGQLLGGERSKTRTGDPDPYWNESAKSVIGAEIELERLTAIDKNRPASFVNVIAMHRSLKVDKDSKTITTNLDYLFERAQKKFPGNQASEMWKTVQGLAQTTASCIFSIANNALDKIFDENVINIMEREKRISFKEMGSKKTALFILTSPVNKSLQNFVNLIYADMFKELFETAEKNESGKLDIPVHIICDDFACGSKIENFPDYISIFRAAGISVTLLLQSETQLESMYGNAEATTIINNCDTYVYMGGMDIETCRHISYRINKPLNKVMSMPLEQVVVFRRGEEPFISRRY
nr:type IV secretory system conjugative DNA transfer family protein [Lachnospiraceae bacterium]